MTNRLYRQRCRRFAQDDWQVLPNLSITCGFRCDYDGVLTEKYGNFFNFGPSLYAYNATTDPT